MQRPEEVMESSRKVLERRLSKSDYPGSPRPYYERWLEILDSGVERVSEVLVDRSEEGCVLRSCSPFTGVISEREREQTLQSFRRSYS